MQHDPTGRVLALLSLLQSHRLRKSAELAATLGVTERTLRRDLDRLRDLGYPVDAVPGRYGGYRLAVGAHLPPLVLDDEEAVAVTVGLRYAAEAAIDGMAETSLRAVTTIEALLPQRLRGRVSALRSRVSSVPRTDDELVDPEALGVLPAACRDHELVRFRYRRGDGDDAERVVEPYQLVTAGRRWYLVAWDRDRDDWRTFRLDRLREPRLEGRRFVPREVPGGDAALVVARAIGSTPRDTEATLVVRAAPADLADVLRWVEHSVVEQRARTTTIRVRGEDEGRLALTVARIALVAPLTVVDPPRLVVLVDQLARHLSDAPAPEER
ncbi:WYL domain-containing protein [Cellulomonas sp. DKR-3]|uniref:WYL domain-containing protein n=1 Tax=Cellulomonas fulva TaxID=2835530 RepID=A0ABS5TW48_9CELL|nr:WYL domain-containing protein [Cellulomonas fulva]MBT0993361.1 WYL domain-containing protein [Cellulomonas fulva]